MLIDDPDAERWAEALAIERRYGDDAPAWIVERIQTLAQAGDIAGVERIRAIAAKLDLLASARSKPAS